MLFGFVRDRLRLRLGLGGGVVGSALGPRQAQYDHPQNTNVSAKLITPPVSPSPDPDQDCPPAINPSPNAVQPWGMSLHSIVALTLPDLQDSLVYRAMFIGP